MWQDYEVRKPSLPEWDFTRVSGSFNPWPYDKYMKTYWLDLVRYGFIREHYDYPLETMVAMIRENMASLARTIPAIEIMQQNGVKSLLALIDAVSTRPAAERFIARPGLTSDGLMVLLHAFRRFIPEPVQLPKLIPDEDQAGQAAYVVLKAHKIATSYPMLDRGRTKAGRAQLAAETGLSEGTVLDFAHRADLSRMWMSGGMVRRYKMVGINTLRDLQQADPHELRLKVEAYYRSIGMGVSVESNDANYIGAVEGAKRMPVVMEE